MVDNKLAQEEAQRAATYEAVKTDVQSEVGGEIVAHAEHDRASQAGRIQNVAGNMREKAVDEVVQTEREVERARLMARISQVVDYAFFLIYGLLGIRLLLELFAARESAGFFQFIKTVTGPFYAPFKGLVPTLSNEGFKLALPIIVALVVYMLLHLAINGLLRMFAHRKVEI
jgi:uncharacterized protein YggT (Ycf19 family)